VLSTGASGGAQRDRAIRLRGWAGFASMYEPGSTPVSKDVAVEIDPVQDRDAAGGPVRR